MTQDDRMETITDPAAIRASDEPDERGDFPCCTTPAPASGAGLDLDALHETICDKFTGMAEVQQAADLLVADVRRLVKYRDWWKASSLANAEDVRRLTAICHDWRDRSEAAEAEVVTLRARLAAVEALADQWADRKRSDGMSGNAWIGLTLSGVAADLRAALATTGEGQHVAREVFTADGIPFVSCSCTNAKSPTSSRWLTDWLIRYDPDDGEPYGEVCDCEIGEDHDATGEGE